MASLAFKTPKATSLAAKIKVIDMSTLTYDITEEDKDVRLWGYSRFNIPNESSAKDDDRPCDKIITVRIFDGVKDVIGEWSIYFFLKSRVSSGKDADGNNNKYYYGPNGEETDRIFYHTAHLGSGIHINEEYQKEGLSRFMGKILADKIEKMNVDNILGADVLFWITLDSTGGFWSSIGMTTEEERPSPQHFGWSPAKKMPTVGADKWMYAEEFCNWANGTKQGTKEASKTKLTYLMDVIKPHTKGKIEEDAMSEDSDSSLGGGRKKRTRKRKSRKKKKKTRRKRRKTTRKKNRKKRTNRRKARRRKSKK
jgi:hypothetical protein